MTSAKTLQLLQESACLNYNKDDKFFPTSNAIPWKENDKDSTENRRVIYQHDPNNRFETPRATLQALLDELLITLGDGVVAGSLFPTVPTSFGTENRQPQSSNGSSTTSTPNSEKFPNSPKKMKKEDAILSFKVQMSKSKKSYEFPLKNLGEAKQFYDDVKNCQRTDDAFLSEEERREFSTSNNSIFSQLPPFLEDPLSSFPALHRGIHQRLCPGSSEFILKQKKVLAFQERDSYIQNLVKEETKQQQHEENQQQRQVIGKLLIHLPMLQDLNDRAVFKERYPDEFLFESHEDPSAAASSQSHHHQGNTNEDDDDCGDFLNFTNSDDLLGGVHDSPSYKESHRSPGGRFFFYLGRTLNDRFNKSANAILHQQCGAKHIVASHQGGGRYSTSAGPLYTLDKTSGPLNKYYSGPLECEEQLVASFLPSNYSGTELVHGHEPSHSPFANVLCQPQIRDSSALTRSPITPTWCLKKEEMMNFLAMHFVAFDSERVPFKISKLEAGYRFFLEYEIVVDAVSGSKNEQQKGDEVMSHENSSCEEDQVPTDLNNSPRKFPFVATTTTIIPKRPIPRQAEMLEKLTRLVESLRHAEKKPQSSGPLFNSDGTPNFNSLKEYKDPFSLGFILRNFYDTDIIHSSYHPQLLEGIDSVLFHLLAQKFETVFVPVLICKSTRSKSVFCKNDQLRVFIVAEEFLKKQSLASMTKLSDVFNAKCNPTFILESVKNFAKEMPLTQNVVFSELGFGQYIGRRDPEAHRRNNNPGGGYFGPSWGPHFEGTPDYYLASALIATPRESMWSRRKIAFLALYKSGDDENLFKKVSHLYPVFRLICYFL